MFTYHSVVSYWCRMLVYVCVLRQGGFVTTSEVDVVVTERENDVTYQCHGTNEELGQTVTDTVKLRVMCTFHQLHQLIYSGVSRKCDVFRVAKPPFQNNLQIEYGVI